MQRKKKRKIWSYIVFQNAIMDFNLARTEYLVLGFHLHQIVKAWEEFSSLRNKNPASFIDLGHYTFRGPGSFFAG